MDADQLGRAACAGQGAEGRVELVDSQAVLVERAGACWPGRPSAPAPSPGPSDPRRPPGRRGRGTPGRSGRAPAGRRSSPGRPEASTGEPSARRRAASSLRSARRPSVGPYCRASAQPSRAILLGELDQELGREGRPCTAARRRVIIPGRSITAIRSRMADERTPAIRFAYRPSCGLKAVRVTSRMVRIGSLRPPRPSRPGRCGSTSAAFAGAARFAGPGVQVLAIARTSPRKDEEAWRIRHTRATEDAAWRRSGPARTR